MLIERRLIIRLLAGQGDSDAVARAEQQLPDVFDTTQYRTELEGLGLDADSLTTVNDPVTEEDPGHGPQ